MNHLYKISYRHNVGYGIENMYVVAPTIILAATYFTEYMPESVEIIESRKIDNQSTPLMATKGQES